MLCGWQVKKRREEDKREKLEIYGRGLGGERMSWRDCGRGSVLTMTDLEQTDIQRDRVAEESPFRCF